ncbi:Hypothetical protein CINCED_3A020579 [Cinara cedri]|uniref:Reverse transcriptase domain n=1 Tax=Cinara cedri TaxID=506608 RepID=A0A5E4MLN9_9HEMI|nr:Hypothetical protein CINCED_3A020579 [Cinara cedri]
MELTTDPKDSECPPPSRIEVVNQLKRLKNNKTLGEDGIQGEILKNLDEVAINRIHDIIENLWSEEQLPKDWSTALSQHKHLTEGKKLDNGSMTPPIERRNLRLNNAKKRRVIYLDSKNVNSRKIYCGKPRPTIELTKLVSCIGRLTQLEKTGEYFDQLLNCENPPESFTWISSDPNDSECPPPSRIEVVNQLRRLKNNKTPGEDGIQGEILKNLDELAINRIHDIIENLWSEEQLPKDLGTALICPIYKKGDPQKCSNYKASLNHTDIQVKICNVTSQPTRVTTGLRQGNALSPVLFNLVLEREVHVLFVDFRKAYDSIHSESLLNILKDFKFPRKIINLIGANLIHTDIQVKIGKVT